MPTRSTTVETYENGVKVDERTVTFEVSQEQVNDETIRAQAKAALANLRTIRDAQQVSVTSVAQAQTACRQLQSAVQTEAAVLIKLGRLLLGVLDDTE